MGPRDRPLPLPDGAACSACGATVPTGRIRVLARRVDVAFLELSCPGCGSEVMGLLLASPTPHGAPLLDLDGETTATIASTVAPRHPTSPPISSADVEAVAADLAAWDGDLAGWLDWIGGDPHPSAQREP